MKLFIPVILGTGREGRESEKAARFIFSVVREHPDIETEFIDVRDYRLEVTDNSEKPEEAKKWAEKAQRADGFIVVSPEYNHGYPGELKMFLDMLYAQYARKPFAVCGVSAGGLGGARMVEQLKLVTIEFHAVPVRESVYFSKINSLFEGEKIKDESYKDRVNKMLDELVWFAGTLKSGRGS